MTKRAAPSLSSFTNQWTYDVFLSFRGQDTRLGFTGHLYNSLHQKGIITFFDDQELRKGEEITPALLKAIQESRIAIIVFSQGYASSSFCLDELVQILHFSEEEGRLVWPIFYDLDPSQVGHQTRTYAEALAKHEERFKDDKDKVQQWRKALHKAAKISGSHFQSGSETEYKFILKIVEDVSKKINRPHLHVADKPVGLESQILKVTSLLRLGSDEGVSMVGIYGTGGIGKTTIARAVYNLIADQFEGLCFLADIREKAINKHGLVQLQETLLCEILGENGIKVGDVNRGIPIIKRRLQQKKVLLILDDVDKLNQLMKLAGGCDWFGPGSKIIITTRNKKLLVTHGVVNLHEVEQLNDEKALDLFGWHAFKCDKVDVTLVDISKRAVSYACGLPLALEVIGSQLFDKSLDQCYSALDKYEKIPHRDIHEILKVSYDDLDEDEKGIFLDIACFFNTYKMDYVKEMLHAHGFHAEDGIRVLSDKSLLKIDDDGVVRMHALIQDMGREIVRQESIVEPGKRSRLWFDADIVHVLEEDTGSDQIEVIKLDVCNDEEVQWSGKAFEKMKNLRILIIQYATFSSGPQHLPNSLRVLDWSYYPLVSLPSTFNPKELLILTLPTSCLKFFQPIKRYESLTLINFEDCMFLTEIPSLNGVLLLRHLCVDNCTHLVRIDDSVGFLDNLVSLSAKGCTRLMSLVPCINLPSLEVLDLKGCSSLLSFPQVLGKMDKIRDIYLDLTAINELPFSIGNLIGLEHLSLMGCWRLQQLPSSILTLPKVEVITDFLDRQYPLFEEKEEDGSKLEISQGAMVIADDCSKTGRLDVYYDCVGPNNVIQVCTPNPLEHPNFELLFKDLTVLPCRPCVVGSMLTSLRSSTCFRFRNKFPKITLCCAGQSLVAHIRVLSLKMNVLINGIEQFSCSCAYITTSNPEYSSSQILVCGLECKVEGYVFSEREWNEVEIVCVLEFTYPGHYVNRQLIRKTKKKYVNRQMKIYNGHMRWTRVYVNKEGNNKEDIKFQNVSIRRRFRLIVFAVLAVKRLQRSCSHGFE
ncbi:hypothetical protein RIF29_06251 [Crotalaria pallida]|uniref:TIR domain-containing protein n=1 Tax=Crotalaria pallida TaxID=3830 RepID=A0AAN9PBE8_CROPI